MTASQSPAKCWLLGWPCMVVNLRSWMEWDSPVPMPFLWPNSRLWCHWQVKVWFLQPDRSCMVPIEVGFFLGHRQHCHKGADAHCDQLSHLGLQMAGYISDVPIWQSGSRYMASKKKLLGPASCSLIKVPIFSFKPILGLSTMHSMLWEAWM